MKRKLTACMLAAALSVSLAVPALALETTSSESGTHQAGAPAEEKESAEPPPPTKRPPEKFPKII